MRIENYHIILNYEESIKYVKSFENNALVGELWNDFVKIRKDTYNAHYWKYDICAINDSIEYMNKRAIMIFWDCLTEESKVYLKLKFGELL